MNSVEDLDVFRLAHHFALETYKLTNAFPREETFGLANQMRRAATSIGMNLFEGSMRLSSREYRQFVGISKWSAGEVCYQLLFAKDLGYISKDIYDQLLVGYDRVLQMLSRLSQSLPSEPKTRPRI
jgi:four helix bundle protein